MVSKACLLQNGDGKVKGRDDLNGWSDKSNGENFNYM